MDVGHGDAVLIEFQDTTTMLIDAGETRYSSRLMSYFKANQIRKIDTVVITHPHRNHFGGLRKIASRIPVGRVFHNGDPSAEKGYSALLSYLERKRVPAEILTRGQKLEQLPDSVTVEVLNPPDINGSANDNSLALWLKHDKVSVLFLADIGPGRQDALLAAFPQIRQSPPEAAQADCVLIPHHGGPLSDMFIEAFQGRLFIVSTGPNRWGLPREDQLKELNGTVYRTDRNGTIVVESDGNTLKVVSWTQNGN